MAQAKQDMGSGSVKKPALFCKNLCTSQKIPPKRPGLRCRPGPAPGRKVLTEGDFFAILYKVYSGPGPPPKAGRNPYTARNFRQKHNVE